jgi:hypothetical protein
MSGIVRDVVVVPSTLALLPEYAGLADPVADLRAACQAAVAWLVERNPTHVDVVGAPARPDNEARGVTRPASVAVARHLLLEADFHGSIGALASSGVLVVANGSATRTEKAPGHLDDRAHVFDEGIGTALRDGDPAALRDLDPVLGAELWCHDVPAWQQLGALVTEPVDSVQVDFEDDPYGVQYWVVRWACGS